MCVCANDVFCEVNVPDWPVINKLCCVCMRLTGGSNKIVFSGCMVIIDFFFFNCLNVFREFFNSEFEPKTLLMRSLNFVQNQFTLMVLSIPPEFCYNLY